MGASSTTNHSADKAPAKRGATEKASATGSERRRSARKPHAVQAWIVSPTATDRAAARTEVASINLSRHGLAFTSARPLAPASYFAIEIGVLGHRSTGEIRIATCTKAADGSYQIGAEFC